MSSTESSSDESDKQCDRKPSKISKQKSKHHKDKKKSRKVIKNRSSSDWSSESKSDTDVTSRVRVVSSTVTQPSRRKGNDKSSSADGSSSDSSNYNHSRNKEQVEIQDDDTHYKEKENKHNFGDKEKRLEQSSEMKQGGKKRDQEHRNISRRDSSDSSDQERERKQRKVSELESRTSDHRYRSRDYDKKYNERSYNSDPNLSKRVSKYNRDSDRTREDRRNDSRKRNISHERRRSSSVERHRRLRDSPDRHLNYGDRRRDKDREDRRDFRRGHRDHRQQSNFHRQKDRKGGGKQQSQSPGSENWGATATSNKEEPNFGLSGKLTEFTNTYKGVVIKYNEPAEARKPRTRWRLYPFKGDEALSMLHIHRQSAYLLGRDRKIADIPVDHPSCSKQHSVLQFRLVDHQRPDGMIGKKVKPYIIDLESTNGTYVNNKRIDPRRYVELMEKDVLKFGFSTREYVLLHEKSKGDVSTDEDEASPKSEEKS